ncbi:1-acyl-sn-glycerol-3-phosphate acyltransferase [Wenzhouxiangella sp. AB-CW3]|uniref:1-acyl-sn-glycerol-3-phosphate acyltransferase n=1 Tax=Wenzhouxiangella sp. AB-CW3 TaxID=2771012 RepID=UPI00168AFB51|nr:1-acyl-sn-glycerol-3-phosphate acyltransferase [Wenzhouxiangella sp. AB-CW3]QOC23112.1 1-acyl-sn-glycerol-3-phosphate acyltransferase [Wenzhouxiangella sp. AB-CW3]
MKLYWLLIRFLRLVNLLYFVDIRSVGREQVPGQGPVIVAANHPSSILDSILLATQIHRPINYLARSGLFRFPVISTVFRWLGAVPIYRPHEVKDYAVRNVAVFDKVFELLEAGGCVGVFPEGQNSPPTRIGPLRKGTARMALGAEAQNDYSLGLVIVPVGVNFENRDFLMNTVLLRFGLPIRVADYAELHRSEPEKAFAELTARIKRELNRSTMHIEDERIGQMVEELSQVFGDTLGERFELDESERHVDPAGQRFYKRWLWKIAAWYRRTTPEHSAAFERRMHSRQQIHDILTKAWQSDPDRVVALNNRLDRYKDHLRQTELREALKHSFDTPVRQRLIRLRMTLYSLLMAPLALFGLVHNMAPYLLTKTLSQLNRDEAVRAFSYFGLGVITFGATYSFIGLWLWHYTDFGIAWSVVYLAALPPTGFVALRYRRNVLVYRDRILVRTLFFNRQELIDLLRRERRLLHEQFLALAGDRPDTSPSRD